MESLFMGDLKSGEQAHPVSPKSGETRAGHPLQTVLESFAGDVSDQVADTASIAPFVVVPRDYFDAIAGDYPRHEGVNDGRPGIATVVDGDQFLCLVSEIALQWSTFGSFLHDGIHFFSRSFLLHKCDHVHDRNLGSESTGG